MRGVAAILVALVMQATAQAQDVKIPVNVEQLAAKAVDTVNVTVDGPMLQLAGKFLSSSDPDQKKIKSLIDNLKGIYVRSFEFANEGEYSIADVESLRSQLKAPEWSRMINVTSAKGAENVDVFFKMEKEKI